MKPVGIPGFSYSLVKTSNYWGSLTLQDLLEIPRARISELWLPELLLLGETALASSLFWRMVSRRLHVIIPAVAVSALNSLGLPPQIGVAIQGFYSNQVRTMKLGKVFGKRLIHGSWALQGCTLSILMVNGIFSGLMAHLNKTCPQVQATTFIDDMKVWAKRENIGMLQSALAEPVEFDRLTGQLISEEKTTVVSRREKQRRFLIQVGRTYKSKSNAKSLRNVHRADKKGQLWHKIRGQTKQQLLCGKLRNFLFATPKKLYTSKPMPAPNGCTALNYKFRQSEPSLALGHMFFSRTGWNVSGPRGCLIWGRLYWPLCCFSKATFSQHQSACVDAPWTTKVLKEAALVQRTVEQTNNGLAAVLAFVCVGLDIELRRAVLHNHYPARQWLLYQGRRQIFPRRRTGPCLSKKNQAPERHDFSMIWIPLMFSWLDFLMILHLRLGWHGISPTFLAGFPKRYSNS